jgi:hypothetical protein
MQKPKNLRFRTYSPNPFIARLNFDRRECSICLTWSFNSSIHASDQPSTSVSSGKTAYRGSCNADVTVVKRRDGSDSASSSGARCSPLSSVVVLSTSGEDARVRVKVGLRLIMGPKLGTKSEFWTFVSVERADTSGSTGISFKCTI